MKEEIDIESVGKALPLKSMKMPRTDMQQDIKEISNLDPSNSYKNVDYLSQSTGVQTEMTREIREQEAMDSTMRTQQYQEAKESFMTMMEIRNVLVDAYEDVKKMRSQI